MEGISSVEQLVVRVRGAQSDLSILEHILSCMSCLQERSYHAMLRCASEFAIHDRSHKQDDTFRLAEDMLQKESDEAQQKPCQGMLSTVRVQVWCKDCTWSRSACRVLACSFSLSSFCCTASNCARHTRIRSLSHEMSDSIEGHYRGTMYTRQALALSQRKVKRLCYFAVAQHSLTQAQLIIIYHGRIVPTRCREHLRYADASSLWQLRHTVLQIGCCTAWYWLMQLVGTHQLQQTYPVLPLTELLLFYGSELSLLLL